MRKYGANFKKETYEYEAASDEDATTHAVEDAMVTSKTIKKPEWQYMTQEQERATYGYVEGR